MIISIPFKTSDAVDVVVDGIVDDVLSLRGEEAEDKREELKAFLMKWIQYGKRVIIRFDTDEGTALVQVVNYSACRTTK